MKKLLLGFITIGTTTGIVTMTSSCKAATAVHGFSNPAYRRFKKTLDKGEEALNRKDVKESKVQMEVAKIQYKSYAVKHSGEQHGFTEDLQTRFNKLTEKTMRLIIE